MHSAVVWKHRHICQPILRVGCKRTGHLLQFSFISGPDGLKKSPYLCPVGTFHLPSTLALDSGFCAGLSDGEAAFFFLSSLRLLFRLLLWVPRSSWRGWLLDGSGVEAGRWMAGAIPNLIWRRASFTSSYCRFLSRRLAERMGDGLDQYLASWLTKLWKTRPRR